MKFLLIALSVAGSGGAQVLIKFASKNDAMSLAWLGLMGSSVALYGLSFVIYSLLLKDSALSQVSPVLTIATSGVVIVAGLFLFSESLTLLQGVGLMLGVAAILLMLL